MSALVVFYSRTGTTKTVAEAIAEALECHLEEIVDRRNRAGLLGYLRSGNDATFGRVADIAPGLHDPSRYDLVLIGTPVWRLSVSSPVRTYLMRHRDQFRRVAFFCTEDWKGGKRVFRQMAELCGRDPIAVLELKANQVRNRAHLVPMERFVGRVRADGVAVGPASSALWSRRTP